jgi:hypothetical protein
MTWNYLPCTKATPERERAKALKKEAQELARKAKTQKKAAATMRAARVTVMNLQSMAAKKHLFMFILLSTSGKFIYLQCLSLNW